MIFASTWPINIRGNLPAMNRKYSNTHTQYALTKPKKYEYLLKYLLTAIRENEYLLKYLLTALRRNEYFGNTQILTYSLVILHE